MTSIRPRRRQEDEFFDRGNDLCQKSPSDMILSYRMLVVEEIIQEEGLCTTEKNKEKKRSRFYDCCVPHCLETFDSTSALEEHYEKNHVHQCHECHRIFPNEYLLDLVSQGVQKGG